MNLACPNGSGIRSSINYNRVAIGKELSILGHGKLVLVNLLPRMVRGHHVLTPILVPRHRPLDHSGRPWNKVVLRIELSASTEPTPDVKLHEPDPLEPAERADAQGGIFRHEGELLRRAGVLIALVTAPGRLRSGVVDVAAKERHGDSGVPLLQLSGQLREELLSGAYLPGTPLCEGDLVERFGRAGR